MTTEGNLTELLYQHLSWEMIKQIVDHDLVNCKKEKKSDSCTKSNIILSHDSIKEFICVLQRKIKHTVPKNNFTSIILTKNSTLWFMVSEREKKKQQQQQIYNSKFFETIIFDFDLYFKNGCYKGWIVYLSILFYLMNSVYWNDFWSIEFISSIKIHLKIEQFELQLKLKLQ